MTHRVRGQILKRLGDGEIRGSYASIKRQLKLGRCSAVQLQQAINQLVARRRIHRRVNKQFPQQMTLSLRKSRK